MFLGTKVGYLGGLENQIVDFRSERKGPIFELDSSKPGCPDNQKNMSMCKEQKLDWDGFSEDDFKNFTLNEFNGARSKFALRANVTSMSKLVSSIAPETKTTCLFCFRPGTML